MGGGETASLSVVWMLGMLLSCRGFFSVLLMMQQQLLLRLPLLQLSCSLAAVCGWCVWVWGWWCVPLADGLAAGP